MEISLLSLNPTQFLFNFQAHLEISIKDEGRKEGLAPCPIISVNGKIPLKFFFTLHFKQIMYPDALPKTKLKRVAVDE